MCDARWIYDGFDNKLCKALKNGSGKVEENERCHDKIEAAPKWMELR